MQDEMKIEIKWNSCSRVSVAPSEQVKVAQKTRASSAATKRRVNTAQTIIELLLVSLIWNTLNSVE